MSERPTHEQLEAVLAVKVNPGRVKTIRGYLHELMSKLWEDPEGFSGKRPFGNSGWEFDLYTALVRAKLVKGSRDSDGCLVEFDKQAADALIFDAIDYLFRPPVKA